MLNMLLLCWGLLQGIQAILTSDLNSNHLQEMSSSVNGGGRSGYTSLLHKVKEAPVERSGTLPRLEFDRMDVELHAADEDLVQKDTVLEPQVLSAVLEAQDREERSPRRCVRLLESCLGHQLPCCDPCATCYCRFFNAFCYCRKISANFPCGKN
ncbi:agouti-related protein [Alligator sinensis]|uniref:Agouti-related protein n=1 Tax=Alligator sinensis TaxID=38654 RepID=A0A1U7RYM5_ALLSI|nr:agouti-related protein [Alligator sinensis]